MADKELRRMNRAKLIDIIYALQQNERVLREDNEKLTNRINDLEQNEQVLREDNEKLTNRINDLEQNEQVLREDNEKLTSRLNEQILQSGSVTEAALNVSRIFEDAQDAADQYLQSIRDLTGNGKSDRADGTIPAGRRQHRAVQEPPEEAGGK